MNATTVQRIATKALINRGGKILLLREAKTNPDGTNAGKWMHPGGRLEPGEPFRDGLRREVREETGLTIDIGEPILVGEWFPVIRDVPHQIVCAFFVCNVRGQPNVRLSNEHDEFAWVGPSDYQTMPIAAPEPIALQRFFEKSQP